MLNNIVNLFIKDKIKACIVLLYLALLGKLLSLDQGHFLIKATKELGGTQLAHTALLLFLTCVFLIIIAILSTKKNGVDIKNYAFDDTKGLYRHIQTNQLVCTSCLLKNDLHSPLKTYDHGWQCQLNDCNKVFNNPDNPPPPKKSGRKTVSKYERERW